METAADSREYRVLFFCPASNARLERLEAPVRRLLSRIQAPPAELTPIQESGALSEAGWQVYLVRSLTERSAAQAMAAYVSEATCALAAEVDAEVLGLYVDVSGDSARICRCGPEDGPETFAGRRQAALNRTAEWLEVAPILLSAIFQLDVPDADYEPDADDRYVEEKLREARVLMERYRQGK
ncbi:hypothetical protein HUA74_04665 [Myxococcus sp. CA051A]|uniref:Uncharacterized protein n=1 Tax=Myxococcus llanfairpwllgwyngyllgogerychwyrndrobwllllantysiliogogogochensis TaxID=2590453 RepID=A0A540WYI9_9BACT|nr:MULTISPECIES: hypothetical protein [Myxococcus]NTX01319.1 hypothetical protein [Myxococcus sp. CA040A]NTX15655.1 hypothetical protein [Myxococcus sp. CA056]NTX32990.1 hypothetical protein [Myxococcus sp. CA033]NTX53461.1 hypothetical protein [Myxococcus sp. CA039A]NTX59946.1 hypothetical protein [Myxococcus sp. CA051A]